MKMTWIRPLCRLFGLCFLVLGASGLASNLLSALQWVDRSTLGGGLPMAFIVQLFLTSGVYLGFGAWMFWGSGSIERIVLRGIHPEGCCRRCGYDLSGVRADNCPECGDRVRPKVGDESGASGGPSAGQ